MDKRILTEIDRSKKIMNYITRTDKKPIVAKPKEQKKTVEEVKIVTLTEFLRG